MLKTLSIRNYSKFIKSTFRLIWISVFLAGCSSPKALYDYEQISEYAPSEVRFKSLSKNADRVSWYFGDGNSTETTDPDHRYLLSGRYEVRLAAFSGNKKSESRKVIYVDGPQNCLVEMETTEGVMLIQLYDATPQHMDNFIKLAESAYYEGLLFHRVINGFMIQGGDPDSRNAPMQRRLGGGGPEYTIPAELTDSLVHFKGALAAARTGDAVNPKKASSGSQFYIVHGKPVSENELANYELQKGIKYTEYARMNYLKNGGSPFLDKEYTVFGRVVKGLDVVDKIAAIPTVPGDRPEKDVKILKVTVIK